MKTPSANVNAGLGGLRTAAPLLAWLGLLIAVIVVFTALGSGELATPSVTDPAAWGPWLRTRPAVDSAFAIGRLVLLGLAWYLLGATVVGTAARLSRTARLVRAADVLTVPAVRRLLQGALGAGLTAAALAVAPSASTNLQHTPSVATATLAAQRSTDSQAAMQLLSGGDAATMELLGGDTDAVALMEQLSGDQAALDADNTWTVAPGDHFWSIADRVLTQAWQRAPSDRELIGYWTQLIEANRGALGDPGNPDLIYPGQVFVLPPAPPVPS